MTAKKAKELGTKINCSDVVHCKGLGGDRELSIQGSLVATICYDKLKTRCKFYVIDRLPKDWDILIGIPYMLEHNCCIQYKADKAILHVGSDDMTKIKGRVCLLDSNLINKLGTIDNKPHNNVFINRSARDDQNKYELTSILKAPKSSLGRINNIKHAKEKKRVRFERTCADWENKTDSAVHLLKAELATLDPFIVRPVRFVPKIKAGNVNKFPCNTEVIITPHNDVFSDKLEILDQISFAESDGSVIVYIGNKCEEPVTLDKSFCVRLEEMTNQEFCCEITDLDKKFKSLKGPEEGQDLDEGLPVFEPLADEEKVKVIMEFVRENVPCKEHAKLVLEALLDFKGAVYVKGDKLGLTRSIEHNIELADGSKPIYVRQYTLPEAHKAEINRQVEDMLSQGLVEEAESEYNNPLIVVQQKDKKRIVVDFRKLNAVTKKSHWPIQNMNSVLANLGGAKFYSSCDLASGYHQIPLAEGCRDMSAFSTDRGSFRFKVMCFGLCNAPSTCARLMNIVLAGLPSDVVLVYLDDLMIMGKTLEEHISNLRTVLERLQRHGLKIKLEKCKFLAPKLDFLGHTVDVHGIRPNGRKMDAIANAPTPKNVQEVKSFLGLISFYREYIPNCSTIAEPLINLQKKNVKFVWEEKQKQAFLELKESLTKNLILAYPKFDEPFLLFTDASNVGTGACLAQLDTQGMVQPIRFSSKVLNSAERNYSTFDRELLAILHGLRANRQFLIGQKVHLMTDHKPLKYLLDMKQVKGRLARYLAELLQYDLEFSYLPGSSNSVADFLSRFPIGTAAAEICACDNESHENKKTTHEPIEPIELEEVREAQAKDWYCIEMKRKIKRGGASKPKHFLVKNGILYYTRDKEVPVLPQCLRERALKLCHQIPVVGHGGYHASRWRLMDFGYFKGYELELKRFIRNCEVCNIRKPLKGPPVPVGDTPPPLYPNHRIHLDLIGRLDPSGGHEYILSIVDGFSRFLVAVPLPDKRAETVARALFGEYIAKFGPPSQIWSDRGKEFVNETLKYLTEIFGTKLHFICPGNPQANAISERSHGSLIDILRTLTYKRPGVWSEFLSMAAFAYNTRHHDAIGCSPYVAYFGREALLPQNYFVERNKYYGPLDFVRTFQENLIEAYDLIVRRSKYMHEENKDRKNKHAVEKRLNPGRIVYVKNTPEPFKSTKLQNKFKGPFIITKRISPQVYEIKEKSSGRIMIEHIRRLKISDSCEVIENEQKETIESKNKMHNYDLRSKR